MFRAIRVIRARQQCWSVFLPAAMSRPGDAGGPLSPLPFLPCTKTPTSWLQILIFPVFCRCTNGLALRPSVPAGKMYPEVSRAYFEAVHAVLSHRQSAAEAASDLQRQLVTMLKSPAADANALRSQETTPARR